MSEKVQDVEDRLVWLLNIFELKASVFQAGKLTDPASFDVESGLSYIHVLRRGKLLLKMSGKPYQLLEEPSIFVYMNPTSSQLVPQDEHVDIICASFDFGAKFSNPIIKALPETILIRQENMPTLKASLNPLFQEAEKDHCGRQAILDLQIEIIIIQLLRDLMDENLIKVGVLAGLAHPKLSSAITAMHARPEKHWTLEELAKTAGMSRAHFSTTFRNIVGETAVTYLTKWRIGIAQSLLSRDKPIQLIANELGYSNASAFSRVFLAHVGTTPTNWKTQYLSKN